MSIYSQYGGHNVTLLSAIDVVTALMLHIFWIFGADIPGPEKDSAKYLDTELFLLLMQELGLVWSPLRCLFSSSVYLL
jgi:hypothetical protein